MQKIFILILLSAAFGLNAQWITSVLPYQGYSNKIEFYNVNTGVSCGFSASTNEGKIYYTTNSGLNWIQSTYPSVLRNITDIQYINSTLVYASGSENIIPISQNGPDYTFKRIFLKSTNSGISWNRVITFDTLSGKFDNIHFFNVNTGYAIENVERSILPQFHKTTNGGLNWSVVSTLDVDFVIKDMEFIDENTGFLVGYVCCGINAMIYKTVNGGATWKSFNYRLTDDFTNINFFNSNNGIVIGRCTTNFNGTTIYRTTDVGETWDSIASFKDIFPTNIRALKGTSTALASAYLIPESGQQISRTYTFKTTDYGLNWLAKNFNTSRMITGCTLIDQNNFFISGGDSNSTAVVLKSTNGGNVFVNKIGNEIPSSFALFQNYPNPFNPTTSIKYQVVSIKFVKLTVFDILGKEIATLVNEKQSPGVYEIQFPNVQSAIVQLPSGIYFYRIQVGDFTDTKKMMMIK